MRYKHLFLIALVFALLILPIVLSEEEMTLTPTSKTPSLPTTENPSNTTTLDNSSTSSTNNTNSPNFIDPKEGAKDVGNAARDAIKHGLESELNDSSVIKSIPLPSIIEQPSKALFQVKDKSITLEILIVLLGFFIMLFIILYEILSEIIDKKIFAFLVTLIITLIISLTGIIYKASNYYFKIFDYGTLKTTFIVFICVLLSFFLIKFIISIFHTFKQKSEVEEAEKTGKRIALLNRQVQRNAKEQSKIRFD